MIEGVVVQTITEGGLKQMWFVGKLCSWLENESHAADRAEKVSNDKNGIYRFKTFDGKNIVDFACTYNAMAYLTASDNKKVDSIVPNKPTEKGLIHFYKKDGEWQYVTEGDFESKKT
jgi:hypothetical protein